MKAYYKNLESTSVIAIPIQLTLSHWDVINKELIRWIVEMQVDDVFDNVLHSALCEVCNKCKKVIQTAISKRKGMSGKRTISFTPVQKYSFQLVLADNSLEDAYLLNGMAQGFFQPVLNQMYDFDIQYDRKLIQ